MKLPIYKMTFQDSCGHNYDGGEWTKQETKKKIVLIQIAKGSYEPNREKIIIHKEKHYCFCDWGDGSFTVHFPDSTEKSYNFKPICLP